MNYRTAQKKSQFGTSYICFIKALNTQVAPTDKTEQTPIP